MRENILKALIATVSAGLLGYFNQLAIPVMMLAVVMVLDYATGLTAAWVHRELDSRTGIIGIIKKLGYLVLVVVGGCVDWLLMSGMAAVGLEQSVSFVFGLVITVWLILNELISILENLGSMEGFPLPAFLVGMVHKLKKTVENAADPMGREDE